MKCIHTIHTHIRRPIRTALAVLAVAAVPAGAIAVPAFAGPAKATTTTTVAAKCPTGWGSLPEASTFQGLGHLTNVRTGRHACFDRIVFDIDGKASWFRVGYVKDISSVGEGKLIPVRGGAKLEIILLAPSYTRLSVHLQPGELRRTDERERLPDLPAGRQRRQLRGRDDDRRRRPRPTPVPRLHPRRPRLHEPRRRRRRPQLVTP